MVSLVTQWAKANKKLKRMVTEKKVSSLWSGRDFFNNRKVAICSMHGKQHVMRPLITRYLGLEVQMEVDINTDAFGTFTGEIERSGEPITTLRNKILKGLESSGLTLGIGNEGSFGPHPDMPFIPCDQEIVMLIDLENDIEIFDVVTSTDTNHGEKKVNSVRDLVEFATQIVFPSHALILKQIKDGKVLSMRKGILGWELLYTMMLEYSSRDTELIAETDMRAHLNPTRMRVIEQATESLLKKIINTCPECQWPGFDCVEIKRGLKCSQCEEPTRLILSNIYQCKHCDHRDERLYTGGREAEPQYCDHCNP